MKDFSGKVAVVTGGASGIGRSLVKELLAAGAHVVIGDVEQSALDRVLDEFAGMGDVCGKVADVSSLESVTALADFVYDRHGACHLHRRLRLCTICYSGKSCSWLSSSKRSSTERRM